MSDVTHRHIPWDAPTYPGVRAYTLGCMWGACAQAHKLLVAVGWAVDIGTHRHTPWGARIVPASGLMQRSVYETGVDTLPAL